MTTGKNVYATELSKSEDMWHHTVYGTAFALNSNYVKYRPDCREYIILKQVRLITQQREKQLQINKNPRISGDYADFLKIDCTLKS